MATFSSEKPHKGKVAVVTGSTYGIGYSIARRLAQDGASVMICSRSQENVDKAVTTLKAEGLTVSGTVCDVLKKNDWKSLIDHTIATYGGIDILISNAGGVILEGGYGPMMDMTEEGWDAMMTFNLKSGFFIAKAAAASMETRGGGSIIFLSSIAGYHACGGNELAPGVGLYSVTKTAILGLVQAMAPQCAEKGIRVNAIAPGMIETPAVADYQGKANAPESSVNVAARYIDRCPMRREGQPEEVAGMASFLCTKDASYITGETITICGGYPTRL